MMAVAATNVSQRLVRCLLQMRAAAVQASRVFSDEALMDRFTALLA